MYLLQIRGAYHNENNVFSDLESAPKAKTMKNPYFSSHLNFKGPIFITCPFLLLLLYSFECT